MNATVKRLTILAAVFAPFLMTGAALLVLPDPLQTFRNTHAEDWIWLILLGGMMLAIYYFAGVYLEDEEEITEVSLANSNSTGSGALSAGLRTTR